MAILVTPSSHGAYSPTRFSVLVFRLTHLTLLKSGWVEGDVSGTIVRLKQLQRSVTAADPLSQAAVADFLSVVPLDGARITLEHCLDLMPLLEDLSKVHQSYIIG